MHVNNIQMLFKSRNMSFLLICLKSIKSRTHTLCLIQNWVNTKYRPNWQKTVFNLGDVILISLTNRVHCTTYYYFNHASHSAECTSIIILYSYMYWNIPYFVDCSNETSICCQQTLSNVFNFLWNIIKTQRSWLKSEFIPQ